MQLTANELMIAFWLGLLLMVIGFLILMMISARPQASNLPPDVACRITKITGDHHPFSCNCDHKLQGTGAVFYQSVGLLYCTNCKGWQEIRQRVNY